MKFIAYICLIVMVANGCSILPESIFPSQRCGRAYCYTRYAFYGADEKSALIAMPAIDAGFWRARR